MNYFPKLSQKDKKILRVENQKHIIENSVNWFSDQMKDELLKHLDRPGWKHESIFYLLRRLNEELAELFEAIGSNETREKVTKESADISNFAMMVADVYRQRLKSTEVEEKAKEAK